MAGYFRGWLDKLLMRMTDLFITFPILVVGAVLGKLVTSKARSCWRSVWAPSSGPSSLGSCGVSS